MIPLFFPASSTPKPRLAEIMGFSAARLNLLPWGDTFTATTFGTGFNQNTRITIGAGVTAPDGLSTAQKLVENSDNNTHFAGHNDVDILHAPTVLRMAVIAKAAERTRIVVKVENASGFAADVSVGFDLAGGNVGYDNVVNGNITLDDTDMTSLGEGWWLCTFDYHYDTGPFNLSSPVLFHQLFLDSGSGTAARSISYAGNGTSGLYVWVYNFLPKGIWELNTRLFHDDFNDLSSIDTSNTKAAGFNWYVNNLFPDSSMPTFGWETNPPSSPTPASYLTMDPAGVLKILDTAGAGSPGWDSQIWSVVTDGAGGYRGQVFKAPMMWEAYVSYEDSHNANWLGAHGTLWGVSVEALVDEGLNPSRHFAEWDVIEFGYNAGPPEASGAWAVHDWENPSSPSSTIVASNAATFIAPIVDPGVEFTRINGVWLNEAYSGNGWGHYFHFVNGTGTRYAVQGSQITAADGAYSLADNGGQADGHALSVFMNSAGHTAGGAGARYWVDWVSVYGLATDPPLRYAFWNVFDAHADLEISDDTALVLTRTVATDWRSARAHIGKSAGKWYWEYTVAGAGIADANGAIMGMMNFSAALTSFPGSGSKGAGLQRGTAANTHVSGVTGDTASSMTWVASDVIGFAFDADDGKVYIHKNGTWLNGTPASGNSVWSGLTGADEWYPAVGIKNDAGSVTITANFGAAAFAHTIPAGFTGLYHETPEVTP